jgi:plasmid maintenance system antidote protein VapI
MTGHNNSPNRGKVFEEGDVFYLLSAAIEREGGQSAFAKRHGLDRSGVNMILHGKKRVTDSVAAALGLRRVYIAK